MTEQHTPQRERQSLLTDKRTGFLAWRTRDILIIAAVGLVFGLLLIGATYGAIVTVAFGSAFQWFWNGLWIIAPVFIAYVLRRPGAIFLTSFLCELVMLIFVPSGLLGLLRGVMYGLCIELAVALVTRYSFYSYARMLLTGAVSGVLIFVGTSVIGPLLLGFSLLNYEPLVVVGIFCVLVISCAICSIVARLLANAVARTGVLSGTALGHMNTVEV
jgi:energy-coupling factor transport system permease protein